MKLQLTKDPVNWIIAACVIAIVAFVLTSCSTTEDSLPECTMATIKPKGDKWCVTIMSDSPSIKMCRDLGTRIECLTIVEHYYQCISIEAHIGEIITFEDNGAECSVTVR